MSLVKANGAGDQDTGFYNGVATQSLRFVDGSSPKLDRTFSSDVDDGKKMTISVWVKRGNISNATQVILSNYTAVRFLGELSFKDTDKIGFRPGGNGDGSSNSYSVVTSSVFRDVCAWYHIVLVYDSTQSTDTDRVKVYVNGIKRKLEVLSGSHTFPPLNYEHEFSYNGANNNLGYFGASFDSNYFDGYLAEFNFLDGIAVSSTSRTNSTNGLTEYVIDEFGEFNEGIWIAKKYAGSYGTNGYRLEFSNTSVGSGSASTIGADTSGNNHHWTSSNVAAHDCNMPDSPENNFPVINPLVKTSGLSITNFTEGNLSIGKSGTTYSYWQSTFAVKSGKWYAECRPSGTINTFMVGITEQNMETYRTGENIDPHLTAGTAWYQTDGSGYFDGSSVSASSLSSSTSFASGDVIGLALDMDSSTKTIKWYKNGSLVASKDLTSNFEDHIVFANNVYNTNSAIWNFGQDSTFDGYETAGSNTDANGIGKFHEAVPSGYLALCSANLNSDDFASIGPDATTNSDDHHNTVLYSGNGSNSHSITGVGHQPDWLWIKRLDGSNSHVLQDSTRGSGSNDSFRVVLSNVDDLEYDLNDHVRSFDSDGFTLDDDTDNTVATNNSGESYVAWSWKLNGGTTSTNNDGSLTSTVQANTASGVSIMTYTGGGSAGDTIGHGLGKAPTMVWFKRRGADGNWMVYVKDMGSNGYINLDRDNGKDTGGSPVNNTDPSSSVITLGSFQSLNSSSSNNTYVAYAFTSIEGFSKVGSYTANGDSSDGPFVYTGFRPAWILIKNTSTTTNWPLLDDTRFGLGTTQEINPVLSSLTSNGSGAEFDSTSYPLIDICSNGFKVRTGGTGSTVASNLNRTAGNLYIYLAFAHQPFKFSNTV
tara:strand:+ start:17 stop:2638 length:2622 start_codon:yes stop_codon:yes gene_type:complete